MKHQCYECHRGEPRCQFCEGGLCHCTVCNGFERQLATDCVGKKLRQSTLDAVWKHYIDFKDGRWVTGHLWWNGRMHSWDEYCDKEIEGMNIAIKRKEQQRDE